MHTCAKKTSEFAPPNVYGYSTWKSLCQNTQNKILRSVWYNILIQGNQNRKIKKIRILFFTNQSVLSKSTLRARRPTRTNTRLRRVSQARQLSKCVYIHNLWHTRMNIVFEISNTILLYCIQYLPNPNREHESHYKSTKEPGNRNKYVNKEKKII